MSVASDSGDGINTYVITRASVAFGQAVVAAVVLTYMEIPFVFLWVSITFLMDFIPYVGALLSIIPPILLGLIVTSDISLDSDRSFNCQSAGLGRYNRAATSGTETGHVTNRPTPAGRLLGLGMGNNGNGPRSPACSHHEDWVGE